MWQSGLQIVSNRVRTVVEITEQELCIVVSSAGPSNMAIRWLAQLMLLVTTIIREWYYILDYVYTRSSVV